MPGVHVQMIDGNSFRAVVDDFDAFLEEVSQGKKDRKMVRVSGSGDNGALNPDNISVIAEIPESEVAEVRS